LFADVNTHDVLWDEYIVLRDSMYNNTYSADELVPLYDTAVASAKENFSEDTLLVALSRCEYIMGRAYSYEENKDAAGARYDAGDKYAEQALDIRESATAHLMRGENISQNCSVKSVSYALSHGTKISGLAKKVLKLDKKYGAAMYLQTAQHIYAPSPFHNHKKGIREMQEILNDSSVRLEKDDIFNLTSAIGYGYLQRDEKDEAKKWFLKALEVYPGNKYVQSLLKDL
jgi:tetratricopeptide (TPR) repeat protein